MDPHASGPGAVADVHSDRPDEDEPAPVLKADPAARRRAIMWLVVLTLALGTLLYSVGRWLAGVQALSAVDAKTAVRQLTVLVWGAAALGGATAFGMAAVLVRLSIEVRRTGQYPLPGARVLRDTPVRTGERARRTAAVSLVLAIMLVIAGVAVIATAWSLWRLLVR